MTGQPPAQNELLDLISEARTLISTKPRLSAAELEWIAQADRVLSEAAEGDGK